MAAPRPSCPRCGAQGGRGRLVGGSNWGDLSPDRGEAPPCLKWVYSGVRTIAWSQEGLRRTGGPAPVWNCLRGQRWPFGGGGRASGPGDCGGGAAGRRGSSRRGREEHPPLAAAAGQLSEQRPRKPQGIGRRRPHLVRGWRLQGCSPFLAPPHVGPGRGVGDPAGSAARLPAPPRRCHGGHVKRSSAPAARRGAAWPAGSSWPRVQERGTKSGRVPPSSRRPFTPEPGLEAAPDGSPEGNWS